MKKIIFGLILLIAVYIYAKLSDESTTESGNIRISDSDGIFVNGIKLANTNETEELRISTNDLSIKIDNINTNLNDISNRVAYLETNTANIAFGIESNEAYRGDWGNYVSNTINSEVILIGRTNIAIVQDGSNIYIDTTVSVLTQALDYGITDTQPYRGDWGNNTSNQVVGIMDILTNRPGWILVQPPSTNFLHYGGSYQTVIGYTNIAYSNKIYSAGNSVVKVAENGVYVVGGWGSFLIKAPAVMCEVRFSIYKNGLTLPNRVVNSTRTRNDGVADSYNIGVGGVFYLTTNDTVQAQVLANIGSTQGYTNLGANAFFYGYKIGE